MKNDVFFDASNPPPSAITSTTTEVSVKDPGSVGVVTDSNVADIANFGIALALIVAAGMSVVYVLIGGFSFITSGGQEDKIKEAVHTIRYAIIGLLITIFAVALVKIVGNIFNLSINDYITTDKIGSAMQQIFLRISGG